MARPTATSGEAASSRLLIKVVLPSQGKERRVPGGGSPPRPFREVDKSFRRSLSTRVQMLSQAVSQSAARIGSAPARVKLLPRAIAKSHRPEAIFAPSTCPIIGAGKLGELFIRATPSGLREIDQMVRTATSDSMVKQLSTIETIESVTSEYRRGGRSSEEILRASPRREGRFVTRAVLFDLAEPDHQKRAVAEFRRVCKANEVDAQRSGYSRDSYAFAVSCETVKQLEAVSRVVSVRSLTRMPIFRAIRPRAARLSSVPTDLPVPSGPLSNYPVVGVVDSGVSEGTTPLRAWVVGQESTVARAYRNPSHGTFVAGLVAFGDVLNPQLPGIEDGPCAIFDLQVIPNTDPEVGDIDELLESQFLQDLDQALSAHANEVRVWNLSLGTDEVCSLDQFSELAVELDRLQEEYNVCFTISAGNYTDPPLLGYPREGAELDSGRITVPADSVLGVAVGSVSHASAGAGESACREGEPSAFSRHGAGPNFIIKPDLVHHGGACDKDGKSQLGVRSLVGGSCGEMLGTSFSTPLVSRKLAILTHHVTPTPSKELARALLTHRARDPRSGVRVPEHEENYFGFGRPPAVSECVECKPWESTLVFEDSLRPGYYLEWDHFPYPQSLEKRGRYRGEIWMTLAFAPARGARWGSEYCETHIDAKFGVYFSQRSRSTGAEQVKFKTLVPPEYKGTGELYESFQVEHLRKWAPVRTYHGRLGRTGVRGLRWRLKLQLLSRHDADSVDAARPQPFALVVTIADPERRGRIYDEMATRLRHSLKTRNLIVRPRVQVRRGRGED